MTEKHVNGGGSTERLLKERSALRYGAVRISCADACSGCARDGRGGMQSGGWREGGGHMMVTKSIEEVRAAHYGRMRTPFALLIALGLPLMPRPTVSRPPLLFVFRCGSLTFSLYSTPSPYHPPFPTADHGAAREVRKVMINQSILTLSPHWVTTSNDHAPPADS